MNDEQTLKQAKETAALLRERARRGGLDDQTIGLVGAEIMRLSQEEQTMACSECEAKSGQLTTQVQQGNNPAQMQGRNDDQNVLARLDRLEQMIANGGEYLPPDRQHGNSGGYRGGAKNKGGDLAFDTLTFAGDATGELGRVSLIDADDQRAWGQQVCAVWGDISSTAADDLTKIRFDVLEGVHPVSRDSTRIPLVRAMLTADGEVQPYELGPEASVAAGEELTLRPYLPEGVTLDMDAGESATLTMYAATAGECRPAR